MKKIINTPETVVEDYIAGLVAGQPGLARVEGWPIVLRSPETKKPDRVAILSGGGSGHEPAHAGYVGRGMLDAAVLGPVFTSPSVDAVFAGIMACATPAGVLLVVKNYTGDRLNFGMAAEMARAEGVRVEMIIVSDDAALGDSSRAGRRGLTATVLVHKVAGAAAERGDSLADIVTLCERLLVGASTMGVALGPCSVPGTHAANFDISDDQVEWGLGIHGESGVERSELRSSREIAHRLVTTLVEDKQWSSGTDVAVLVNSLGGTPDLELRILQRDVLDLVAELGLIARVTIAGPLLTSLEMPGASVTIAEVDPEILALITAPSATPAFPAAVEVLDAHRTQSIPAPQLHPERPVGQGSVTAAVEALHERVTVLAHTIIDAEHTLTELDRTVGDGDLGINLARGANALLADPDALRFQPTPAEYLTAVSAILRREIGGTSGPLYGLLVLSMSDALSARSEGSASEVSPIDWSSALATGTARIRSVGGAAPGDSTMIDALQPAVDALLATGGDLTAAAAAAKTGADSTAAVRPSLGRSSYVGARAVGVPDPGAVAVALQFEALAAAVPDGAAR